MPTDDFQHNDEHQPLIVRSSREDIFDSSEFTRVEIDSQGKWAPIKSYKSINGNNEVEKKRSYKEFLNMFLPLFVLMITEAPRGIFVPTLVVLVDQLGGDAAFLGYVVAAFSVGRFVSTTFLGYWSGKRTYKEVLAVSILLSMVGNIMHVFSIVGGKELLLVSKFVAGLGAGVLSVVRAYASAVTTEKERTSFMSAVGAVQFIGFAMSPGLGSALEYFPRFSIGKLEISELTSPGLLLAILDIISVLLVVIAFENPSESADSERATKKDSSPPKKKWVVIYTFGFFLFLNFIVRFVLGIVETLGTPIYREVHPSPNEVSEEKATGFYFLVLGLFGLLDLFLIGFLSRLISDVYLLLFGLLALCAGCVVFIDINHLTYLTMTVGFAFIWSIGFPLAQTIIVSMFSKVIGPGPQGTMMGWIGVMGSLGRIVGPVFAGWMDKNEGVRIVFVVAFGCSVVALLLSIMSLKILNSTKKK